MKNTDLHIKILLLEMLDCISVNPDIFVRVLFWQLAVKGILATFKIHHLDMIYLHQ